MLTRPGSVDAAGGEGQGVDDNAEYAVDAKALEQAGRSFAFAARNRLCGSCELCLSTAEDEGAPLRSETEYMKQIVQSCSRRAEYLLPGTSLTEAVFRLLLANQNRSMKLQEIQSGLAAAWASAVYLKNLGDEVVVKLLETPNEYFIRRVN